MRYNSNNNIIKRWFYGIQRENACSVKKWCYGNYGSIDENDPVKKVSNEYKFDVKVYQKLK